MRPHPAGVIIAAALGGALVALAYEHGGFGSLLWLAVAIGGLVAFGIAWDRFERGLELVWDHGLSPLLDVVHRHRGGRARRREERWQREHPSEWAAERQRLIDEAYEDD